MQQPLRPAEDQLGHDDDGDRVRVGRDPPDVPEERVTEVAEVRLLDVERDSHRPELPFGTHPVDLVRVEREEERLRIGQAQRAGVVHRPHRGRV